MPASVSDVRLAVTFRDHPKRRRLRRRLGADGVLALIDLWSWAGANRPDGRLTSLDAEDVEAVAMWDGEEGALVAALLDLRFLERAPDGAFLLHDWEEHQSWAVGAEDRADAARRAAEARWAKQRKVAEPAGSAESCAPHAPRTEGQSEAVRAAMPLSSPFLSSPSLTEKEPARAWGAPQFRAVWQEVTANTAPISDDVARAGADAVARSAEAAGTSPSERGRAIVEAFVELERVYREAAHKGSLGHAPPSRSASALVTGAAGRWWGEAEQWLGGWRPTFAPAPSPSSSASSKQAPGRHVEGYRETMDAIRKRKQVEPADPERVRALLASVAAGVGGVT